MDKERVVGLAAIAFILFLIWPKGQSEDTSGNVDGASRTVVAAGNCAGIHWVKPGETLSAIATQHGHTVAALAQASGISNPNRINPGQQICLPKSPAPAASGGAADSCTAKHTVAASENLTVIADKYGTTASALAARNGLANPNYVGVNWELCVSP